MPELNAQQFYDQYWDMAVEATEGTKIFPEVLMAQMAKESNWGNTANEANGYSMFGVKTYEGYTGKVVNNATTEFEEGVTKDKRRDFQAYDGVEDSMKGYIRNLQAYGPYSDEGVFSAETPEEQIEAIGRGGYATNPNYADATIHLMNQSKEMGLGVTGPQFDIGNSEYGYKKDEAGNWNAHVYAPDKTPSNSATTGNEEDDYLVIPVVGEVLELNGTPYVYNVNKGKLAIKELPDKERAIESRLEEEFNPFKGSNQYGNESMNVSQFSQKVAEDINKKRGDGQWTVEDFGSIETVLGLAKQELDNEVVGAKSANASVTQYEKLFQNMAKGYIIPAYKKDFDAAEVHMQSEIDRLKSEQLAVLGDADKVSGYQSQIERIQKDKKDFVTERNEIFSGLNEATEKQGTKKVDDRGGFHNFPAKMMSMFGGWMERNLMPNTYMPDILEYQHTVDVGANDLTKINKIKEFRNRYQPHFEGTALDNEPAAKQPKRDATNYYPGSDYSGGSGSVSVKGGSKQPDDMGPVEKISNRSQDKVYTQADIDKVDKNYMDIVMDLDTTLKKGNDGRITKVTPTDPAKIAEQITDLDDQLAELQKPKEEAVYEPDLQESGGLGDNLLDAGRGLMGLKGALTDVPKYERGAAWSEAMGDMTARKDMGLSPDEIAFATNMNERGYGYDVKNIRRLAGGSAGVALGNLGRATGQLQDGSEKLAARDEATRRMNQQQFYQGAAQDEQINRQIFEDDLSQKMMTKQAGAGLLNDAITNIKERKDFEKNYGKGSQMYEYQKEMTLDAKMKREGMEEANAARKKESIDAIQAKRDELAEQQKGLTNNITTLDGNEKVTPVTTTQVQGGAQNVPKTEDQATSGGGIIGDAGGEVPKKDPIERTPEEQQAEYEKRQAAKKVGGTEEVTKETGAGEPGPDYFSDKEKAEREKVNEAKRDRQYGIGVRHEVTNEGDGTYDIDGKKMSKEEYEKWRDKNENRNYRKKGYTKTSFEDAMKGGSDADTPQKVKPDPIKTVRTDAEVKEAFDDVSSDWTPEMKTEYDNIRNKEEHKDMTDQEFLNYYNSDIGETGLGGGSAQPGTGITGSVGADATEVATPDETTLGANAETKNGKALSEQTDEELQREGVTREVKKNDDGSQSVAYSQVKDIDMNTMEQYKSRIESDAGDRPYVHSEMKAENKDYQAKITSLDKEFDSEIDTLEKEVSAYEEEGNFKKADSTKTKVEALMLKKRKKSKAINEEYDAWADKIIDGWKS